MIDFKPSINFWHDFKSNQAAGVWLFLGSRRSLQIIRPSILQLIFWGILGGLANTLLVGWSREKWVNLTHKVWSVMPCGPLLP